MHQKASTVEIVDFTDEPAERWRLSSLLERECPPFSRIQKVLTTPTTGRRVFPCRIIWLIRRQCHSAKKLMLFHHDSASAYPLSSPRRHKREKSLVGRRPTSKTSRKRIFQMDSRSWNRWVKGIELKEDLVENEIVIYFFLRKFRFSFHGLIIIGPPSYYPRITTTFFFNFNTFIL